MAAKVAVAAGAETAGNAEIGRKKLTMKRIYVGNLDAETTAADVQLLFQQYGKVSKAGIITDPVTGRSRGFAFVLMGNDHEADEAIENLNRETVAGRRIDVKEALPPGERPGDRDKSGKRGQ